MRKEQIIYLERPGPQNTEDVIDAVTAYIARSGLERVVVASTTGSTATKFAKALEAVSQTFSSGHPMNPSVMKTITDLVMALKEEVDNEPNSTSEYRPTENKSAESERRAASPTTPTGTDKVENLTNTLLNLLNPKK